MASIQYNGIRLECSTLTAQSVLDTVTASIANGTTDLMAIGPNDGTDDEARRFLTVGAGIPIFIDLD